MLSRVTDEPNMPSILEELGRQVDTERPGLSLSDPVRPPRIIATGTIICFAYISILEVASPFPGAEALPGGVYA